MAQPVKQRRLNQTPLFAVAKAARQALERVAPTAMGVLFEDIEFVAQPWNTKHRVIVTEDSEYIRVRVKNGAGEEHTLVKVPLGTLDDEQRAATRKAISSWFGTILKAETSGR